MANPFTKGWKTLMATFDSKIDENADPKVQIKQAVDQAKKQHRELSAQAAEVIGRKNQLEMQINRLVQTQQDRQDQTRRALELADASAAKGDEQAAAEYNQAAEVLASQLVSTEQELESLRTQYEQAVDAAQQAQAQQQQSEARLQEQLSEVDQLLAQVDQAKMQEKTNEALGSMEVSVQADENVPSLDSVRDKIERRYATALGQQELLGDSTAQRYEEIASSAHDMKASARLAEIRAAMGSESTDPKQIESTSSED